jgi:hypothetical protein
MQPQHLCFDHTPYCLLQKSISDKVTQVLHNEFCVQVCFIEDKTSLDLFRYDSYSPYITVLWEEPPE